MYGRTLCCGSLSKTYSITGWRLGYIFAPPEITEAIKKLHVYLTISAPSPLQEAAITGLRFGPDYYQGLRAMYTRKRDFVMKRLDDIGIGHNVPQGAFYMLVDIGGYGYDDDEAFCRDLAEKSASPWCRRRRSSSNRSITWRGCSSPSATKPWKGYGTARKYFYLEK